MGKEMVIGQTIKRGEDIFIRDKDQKIIGQKNTHVEMVEEKIVDKEKRRKIHEEHTNNLSRSQRTAEYPDFGEFADMMFHSMTERKDNLLPAESAWYDKCAAVKKKYPPKQ